MMGFRSFLRFLPTPLAVAETGLVGVPATCFGLFKTVVFLAPSPFIVEDMVGGGGGGGYVGSGSGVGETGEVEIAAVVKGCERCSSVIAKILGGGAVFFLPLFAIRGI